MPNDFKQWLETLGLGQYAGAFAENDIDFEVLPHLTEGDLKDLGLSIGHRRILQAAIQADPNESSAAAERSDPRAPDATKQGSQGAANAERRQLTVMFCDLVGSTALSAMLDPEDMREVLRAYQDACAGVVVRYDGYVANFLGDGVLVYFGYPRAHEDDAERAVSAGLGIVDAIKGLNGFGKDMMELAVRIGIATGTVVVGDLVREGVSEEAVITGETPNLAARLQEVADTGTVVIAPSTHRLTGARFECDDLGDHDLKGLTEKVRVWRVTGERAAESRFEATRVGRLTRFVGREQEIALLLERWEQAKQGEGQVALLSGEAGIGKSRITQAMRDRIGEERHTRLRYQCSPHFTSTAFHPFIVQLERAARLIPTDPAEAKLDKIEDLLTLSTDEVAATAPLFAALLSVPTGDRYPQIEMTPPQRKERTLNALTDQLIGLAARQPVVLIFEDAHWVDPTTLEVLERMVDRIQDARVFAVITFRPEFEPPWHGHTHVTSLTLNRLTRNQCATMVEDLTGGKTVPRELVDQIVAKTDGVPLFAEELTKTVLESELLEDAGDRYVLTGPLPPLAIPATLHDALMARLDRMAPVKEVAQIGAVIGREFPHRLLGAVTPLGDNELSAALGQLVEAEVIFRRGTGAEAVYIFKHALVQDAAYGSLLRGRRVEFHGQIARALEELSPETAETAPEILAHHYTEAGLIEPAIAYWQRAGARSVTRSAHAEAIAQFRNALELIEKLPESPERDARELDLLIGQFNPIMASKGYGAPELDQAQVRALALCEILDDRQKILPILHGRYTYNQGIGRPAVALEFAQAYLHRAESLNDDTALMIGHRATGAALWHVGRLGPALEHVEQTVELYRTEPHRALVTQYGYDIKTTALMVQIVLLGSLGYLERAATILREAVEFSRALDHPESLAFLIGHLGLTQHFIAREPSSARKCAEELQALAEEFELPTWLPGNRVHLGRSVFEDGDHQKGIQMMQESLGGPDDKKVLVARPAHLVLLADALARTNDLELSLSYLDAAQKETDIGEDRWSEAEIWRVRGDALLESAREAEAEASYRRAIDIAHGQEAKTFELRAATSLAHYWHRQNRNSEARDLLAPVHGWFTEGFDTADLKDAKSLLDTVS